jgi:uncharacterized protein (DUF983 family)
MRDCPKCVAGSLFWSDTFQAWECDVCGEVVEMGADSPTDSNKPPSPVEP